MHVIGDPIRAGQAWHGFLTWGRWNDALFGRMQPFVRLTFGRMDALGEQQGAFGTALAGIAAYSQVDPWHNNGWLFQFVSEVGEEQRAGWASDFGRFIESLSADGINALWNRWLSDYWDSRITGIPRPLSDVERRAMVAWLCGLKVLLSTAVDRVLAAPPTLLDHYTFYRLAQCGIAASHGADVGRLLRGLMAALNQVLHDTGELSDLANAALEHGAVPADIIAVTGDMLRLGCAGGERLRELASGGAA